MSDRFTDCAAEFHELAPRQRLELLLDYATDFPPLPAHIDPAEMEPVPECQAPLSVLVDATVATAVRLYLSVPETAPTTRGFASLFHHAWDGASAAEILAAPEDLARHVGLAESLSPLRAQGVAGMVRRIKAQIRSHGGAEGTPAGVIRT